MLLGGLVGLLLAFAVVPVLAFFQHTITTERSAVGAFFQASNSCPSRLSFPLPDLAAAALPRNWLDRAWADRLACARRSMSQELRLSEDHIANEISREEMTFAGPQSVNNRLKRVTVVG